MLLYHIAIEKIEEFLNISGTTDEKLDKLTANQAAPETKTQSGLESLKKIYDSGYHICNMYYGSHRDPSADCMFCLDILDNFGEKKGKKKDGR